MTVFVFSLLSKAGVDQSTLLYLAVFKVVPLELVGVLEISRRVGTLPLAEEML